jgi:hypothetical protein
VKRGFNAHAERMSLAERNTLGLSERCRLDPGRLAEVNGVPVIPLSALAVPHEHLAQLQTKDPGAFSAAAVVRGDVP